MCEKLEKRGKKRFYKNIINDFELKQMRNSCNPKYGCTATSHLQLDYDDKMNASTNNLMNIFDTKWPFQSFYENTSQN